MGRQPAYLRTRQRPRAVEPEGERKGPNEAAETLPLSLPLLLPLLISSSSRRSCSFYHPKVLSIFFRQLSYRLRRRPTTTSSLSLFMSQLVPILKGRVAQVKKANNAASIEKNSWSVVASDGLYTADTTRQSSSVHKSKLCDLYFFATKEEAWEHSASILSDDQQEQEAVTAARISRSLGESDPTKSAGSAR